MPIPSLTSTGFTAKEDSKYLSEDPKDPTMRAEAEGGFVMTRARFTRAPPRVVKTGFTNISEADRAKLKAFYDAQRGGAGSFGYTHPVSGESLTVRFAEPPRFRYAGVGATFRWDVPDIKLEEV